MIETNMIICPNCQNNKFLDDKGSINCLKCNKKFYKIDKFIDFIDINSLTKIQESAKKIWGGDLHSKNFSVPNHYKQIKNIFKKEWDDFFKDNILEIGCGSGSDLKIFSNFKNIKILTAIDLGDNLFNLHNFFKTNNNVKIYKASALNLPFANKSFNTIYSFGVFHHTNDPIKCFKEAFRVLNKNGTIFLYLYSMHEDNFFKYTGIILEKYMMLFLKQMPYIIQNIYCTILSPFMWLIFTIPAFIIKNLGFSNFAKKIPMNWGTHPFSLIYDLKDRLMSPINHRFKKKEMEQIIRQVGFNSCKVVKKSSGIYIFASK